LKSSHWDYQKKVDLALKLGLTFPQVSKWNWDRKKKEALGMDANVPKKKGGKKEK